MRKTFTLLASGLVAALALTACGGGSSTPSASDQSNGSGSVVTLKVGSSPVPQAKILEFVNEKLAPAAGLKLDIQEMDDYQTPNIALSDGSLDANYFQHLPFLQQQIKDKGYKFEHGAGIHVEPYAAFSDKHKSLSEISDGAKVAITSDPSNQPRALKLLQTVGLLKNITDDSSILNLTDAQNPKHLNFSENQPELLVNDLKDPTVDLAILNGNYFLEAGLSIKDALAVESAENNPYANFLVWRTDEKDNPAIAKLEALLHSPEVKKYIQDTWPNGDVIPAF